MAKKSVDVGSAAYKNKGMKTPRPGSGPALDPSKAPVHKPSHAKRAEQYYKKPSAGEQSAPPSHQKKSKPSKEAPEMVKGVNEGSDYGLPKSGGRGESEV